ncbi:MAG: hypothetical protein R3F17_15260 [Planctomycetota bacterium]
MKPLLLACLLAFPSHPVSRTVVPQAPTRVTEPQDSAKVRRFAQRLMRTIEEMYPARQLEYDEAENRIVDRSSGLVIHLENLYRDYAALGLPNARTGSLPWPARRVRKPHAGVRRGEVRFDPADGSRSKLEWLQLQNACGRMPPGWLPVSPAMGPRTAHPRRPGGRWR